MNQVEHKSYSDAAGNVYRIEQASNKMFLCVRINAGGNRKGWNGVQAQRKFDRAQIELDDVAQKNGWKEVTK